MPRNREVGQGLWPTVAGPSTALGLTAGTTQANSVMAPDVEYAEYTTVAASGIATINDLHCAAGDELTISNMGANSLTPYPPVGGKIGTGATNAAGTAIPAGGFGVFVRSNTALVWLQK